MQRGRQKPTPTSSWMHDSAGLECLSLKIWSIFAQLHAGCSAHRGS